MDLISSLKTLTGLTDYILIVTLLIAAVWFTLATRGVQFRMIGEMCRLLIRSGRQDAGASGEKGIHGVSSFQAFALSIASRVGTGNLAGVALAIAIGGPGAVFWMWVIALLGAATAFIESTLAQIYKVRGERAFQGGPAYYILRGTGRRWWAVTFAVLITVTFGLAFNSVQSNTIAEAMNVSFGVSPIVSAIVLTVLTLAIIWGGIRSIARFSEIVVPVMAIAYIILALVVIAMNISNLPAIFLLIVKSAFGFGPAVGGSLGVAMIWGIKRGLFSNEAGEGSTPNAAATATTSHPVKQGLVQALGVYTDTIIICTATAFIILCSGIWTGEANGITLTQHALDHEIGDKLGIYNAGAVFVSIAIFFFAFTSIIANYYYGETNIRFICSLSASSRRRNLEHVSINLYRVVVGTMVFIGAIASLDLVWCLADITMALMTLCNLAALFVLGRYAVRSLEDYQTQKRLGLDPRFLSSSLPDLPDHHVHAGSLPAWPK